MGRDSSPHLPCASGDVGAEVLAEGSTLFCEPRGPGGCRPSSAGPASPAACDGQPNKEEGETGNTWRARSEVTGRDGRPECPPVLHRGSDDGGRRRASPASGPLTAAAEGLTAPHQPSLASPKHKADLEPTICSHTPYPVTPFDA